MKWTLLRDWRILMMIVCVVLAIWLILPIQAKGVVVKSIASDSPLTGKIQVGELISWANEKEITTPEDLYPFENFTGTFRFMHSGELDLVEISTPGLGISLVKQSPTRVSLGMDLVGGTRILLKPVENVTDVLLSQVIATLETRINIYGLREAKFQVVTDVGGNRYVQIEMAGGSRSEIDSLLAKEGKFEGRIAKEISLPGGLLSIGNRTYNVTSVDNETIKINDDILKLNGSIILDQLNASLLNITNNSAVVAIIVFSGTDIKSVCMQEQPGVCTSRVLQQANGWEFMFQVFISQEAAQRFADATKDMKSVVDPNSGEAYLNGRLLLLLDDKLITDLRIAADLAGKAYTEPVITGGRTTKDETVQEKLMLQSILTSGALPTKLEIVRVDQISASLGLEFMKAAMFASIVAAFAVAGVIYAKYRKIIITIPMMGWVISEVILVLGVATIINWTIDLGGIAGIIAAIGTGVNDQIIMIDEILLGGKSEKAIYTTKQKLKRAFFIVFGAAGTIIAAMLPLLFIGIGVMRGFAITTSLGVLVGVFITRPAFGRVAEAILSKEELSSPPPG